MGDRQSILNKIFLGVSVLGSLFVLTEAAFKSFGSSICATEGCRVIAESARFGDIPILLAGLAAFSLLAALSAINLSGHKPGLERAVDLLLVISLAAEGFFTGYQAFSVSTACIFCLTVFAFLVVLGLLRLAAGKKELIAGFGSLLAVFSLFYLVPTQRSIAPLPDNEKLVLFYSRECKHCSDVIRQFEEDKVAALHVPVEAHSGILKSIGIEHVPTLLVNNGAEKTFFTGREAIQRYLSSRISANDAKRNKTGNINDLFGPLNTSFQSPVHVPEEGVCKEASPCN
jgi:uncharacterized membrane protein